VLSATFKDWEIIAVLIIGLTLVGLVAKRPKLFWPLLIIVNMLGIGPLLMGYSFWDKLLTGFILMGALLRSISVDKCHLRNAVSRDGHKLIFGLWVGYMIMESVIGVIANSDLRTIYWILFYAMLGLLSYILYHRGRDFPFPTIRQFSLIVLVTVLIYNIAYLAYGVIVESLLAIGTQGRFAAQFLLKDSIFAWTPPSAATFPTIIGMPAAIFAMKDDSLRVRMLAWYSIALMMIVAFYYSSRSAWIVIFCILLVSLRKIRVSRIIPIILIFGLTFYIFAFVDVPIYDFFHDITKTTQLLWSPSEGDMSRNLQFKAGFMRITDNVVTFFVGDGIYSHKVTIIPYIEDLYEQYMPEEKFTVTGWQEHRDDTVRGLTVFRTTAFTALLIDTGVIGMLSLILLFIFAAYKVISRKGPHRTILLITLLLAFTWQFSINITGIVLFYLLFMPCGLVEQLSKNSATIKPIRKGL
jgi:hypothetical protein